MVAAEGGAVGVLPEPGGRAGDVRAVALAVEGVVVGLRDGRGGVVGVVVVAGEVEAADDLRGGERAAVGLGGIHRAVRRDGPGAAEVGVGVVDAGVDDADAHAGAEPSGLPPGIERPAELVGVRVGDAGIGAAAGGGDRADAPDGVHAGFAGELAGGGGGGAHGDAGHRVGGAEDDAGDLATAEAGEQGVGLRRDGRLRVRGGAAGGVAALAFPVPVGLEGRRLVELDEQRDRRGGGLGARRGHHGRGGADQQRRPAPAQLGARSVLPPSPQTFAAKGDARDGAGPPAPRRDGTHPHRVAGFTRRRVGCDGSRRQVLTSAISLGGRRKALRPARRAVSRRRRSTG